MTPLRIALVGCGQWGKNYLRALTRSAVADLRWVVDPNPVDAPPAPVARTLAQVDSREVDAAIIATPSDSHMSVATQCLARGWHVLVEKPVSTSVQLLDELPAASGQVVLGGHLLNFHPSVRKLRDIVRSPEFGTLHAIDAVRYSTNTSQRSEGPVWNLAVHDLAMIDFVAPLRLLPEATAAEWSTKESYSLLAQTGSGVKLHLCGGRHHARATRRITFAGSKQVVTLCEDNDMDLVLETGTNTPPLVIHFPVTQPLDLMVDAFIQACRERSSCARTHLSRVTCAGELLHSCWLTGISSASRTASLVG